MSDTIRITGLRLKGYHGVYPHEKRDGQTFVVDLAIEIDASTAASSDDLANTLDYSVVVDQVAGRVTGEPVDLIETLAADIAEIVLTHHQVIGVEVSVHKPEAPVGYPLSDISLTIYRQRSGQ